MGKGMATAALRAATKSVGEATQRGRPDVTSTAGPMRLSGKIFKEGFLLSNSVNVVSIKIVSSDYGYPINVYGTILARDSLDRKCIYLFRRDQDNCQLISSKDDSLILTGPKRGFMVYDDIFFETYLKVKDVHGRTVDDDRLSKGLMEVDAIRRLAFKDRNVVETETLVFVWPCTLFRSFIYKGGAKACFRKQKHLSACTAYWI